MACASDMHPFDPVLQLPVAGRVWFQRPLFFIKKKDGVPFGFPLTFNPSDKKKDTPKTGPTRAFDLGRNPSQHVIRFHATISAPPRPSMHIGLPWLAAVTWVGGLSRGDLGSSCALKECKQSGSSSSSREVRIREPDFCL